ncbi:MAG: ammonium transporter, partial [Rhodanobacter sp.]
LLLGLCAGVISFFAATRLKRRFGYDDSLDVFGVHAVAGIVGALLTGPFAAAALGGFGEVAHPFAQLWIQARGVGFTVLWSGSLSLLILKIVDWTVGLRVDEEQEQIGLDLALHEERAYNLI